MLIILIVTFTFVLIRNKKKLFGEWYFYYYASRVILSKIYTILVKNCLGDSTNNIGNNMIPNPIYDGPLYESVQPHFDSLTSQVTAASCNPLTTNSNRENELELCLDNRYVHQPGLAISGSLSCSQNQPSTDGQLTQCKEVCTFMTENDDSVKQQSKFIAL